jgi:carbon storage regulator CsrA
MSSLRQPARAVVRTQAPSVNRCCRTFASKDDRTMLVLSRRPDEKILLPTVPAIIKVISSQAGLVRLGIEAPSHIPILREELTRDERKPGLPAIREPLESASPNLRHFVRNRLNNLILGLTLLRMHLVDSDPVVRKTLDGIEEELQSLRQHVMAGSADADEPVGEELTIQAPAGASA